jgi:hypothetical protein
MSSSAAPCNFEFLEVPNKGSIHRFDFACAGYNYESVFKRSITFFVVGVIDEISSIIKQYSKAERDDNCIAKVNHVFTLDFLLISSVVKSSRALKRFLFFEKIKNLR